MCTVLDVITQYSHRLVPDNYLSMEPFLVIYTLICMRKCFEETHFDRFDSLLLAAGCPCQNQDRLGINHGIEMVRLCGYVSTVCLLESVYSTSSSHPSIHYEEMGRRKKERRKKKEGLLFSPFSLLLRTHSNYVTQTKKVLS